MTLLIETWKGARGWHARALNFPDHRDRTRNATEVIYSGTEQDAIDGLIKELRDCMGWMETRVHEVEVDL